jgi:hypothetical protein
MNRSLKSFINNLPRHACGAKYSFIKPDKAPDAFSFNQLQFTCDQF